MVASAGRTKRRPTRHQIGIGDQDAGSVVIRDTQCYDLGAGAFNAPNADLGQFTEGVWGMSDGELYQNGDYQLWLANGAVIHHCHGNRVGSRTF